MRARSSIGERSADNRWFFFAKLECDYANTRLMSDNVPKTLFTFERFISALNAVYGIVRSRISSCKHEQNSQFSILTTRQPNKTRKIKFLDRVLKFCEHLCDYFWERMKSRRKYVRTYETFQIKSTRGFRSWIKHVFNKRKINIFVSDTILNRSAKIFFFFIIETNLLLWNHMTNYYYKNALIGSTL